MLALLDESVAMAPAAVALAEPGGGHDGLDLDPAGARGVVRTAIAAARELGREFTNDDAGLRRQIPPALAKGMFTFACETWTIR